MINKRDVELAIADMAEPGQWIEMGALAEAILATIDNRNPDLIRPECEELVSDGIAQIQGSQVRLRKGYIRPAGGQ